MMQVTTHRNKYVLASRFLALSLIAVFLSFSLSIKAQAKYAAFVMDPTTGQVLYAVNADTRNYPASLTKMMTLYMMFDALEKGEINMNTEMPVSRRAEGQPPSKLGLKRGQTIRVEDAIYALITKSANDVATVVAEFMGEKEWQFAKEMTNKARQLGMTRTTFKNASGLPNRGQLSTARDMATLGIALQRDFPQYYDYFKTQKWSFRGRTYGNHNKLLKKYEGTDGIKTGYTRASGFNLVSSVERDGYRLIGVVLGGRTGAKRNAIMAKILDQSYYKLAPAMMAKYETKRDNTKAVQVASAITNRTSTAWGVQVGAYGDFDTAQKLASAAIKRAPSYLTGAKAFVAPLKNGRKTLFRARVGGVEKREAYRACKALKKMRQPCMVFKTTQKQIAMKN